jgi:hypothetical protein
MRIPPAVSRRIGKPLLDLAENLPPFSGGVIQHLQHERKMQRQYATQWQAQAAPPEGTILRYRLFRLLELYTADEIGSAIARVEKVIPPHWGNRDNISGIDSPSFRSGGFKSLGLLSQKRPGKKFRSTPGSAYWSLPPQVSSVHLIAHQILPAAYLVTADVRLTEAAEERFRTLQAAEYLPQVTISSIQRIPPWFLGTGITSPHVEQRKAISTWVNELHFQTEAALEPFFRGHFSRERQSSIPSLPAIEVMTLEGAPTEDTEFAQWGDKARMFFSSIGEEIFPYTAYKGDDTVVSIYSVIEERRRTAWRVYLLGAPQANFSDIAEAEEFCSALQPWTTLLSFAESLDRSLHRLQALAAQGRRDWGLRRYFRLYANLVDDYTLFSRLKGDIKQLMKCSESKRLAVFTQVKTAGGREPAKLSTALESSVKHYFKSLKTQAEATMNSTKEYLGLRNMRLIYLLQLAVLMISLCSAVLAYMAVRQAARTDAAPTPAQRVR